MGQMIALAAKDGFQLAAYEALPAGKPRGGIVVLQEIFGLTRHVRNVVDQYAGAGYYAIAPGLFDRAKPGVELPYTDIPGGLELMQALKPEQTLADIEAAVAAAAKHGKVGVVGYCWGGTLTWLAACNLPIAAAASYYGGWLPKFLDRQPNCPVIFHFGEQDGHIPLTDVDKVKAFYPAGEYHLYPAGHGFNCTDRVDYEAVSSNLAFARTLNHFAKHVG
jgi:carboxymethylenebutenolidase